MVSIFRRMFKVGQSHAHSAMDKFEDPIQMTEQGVRDLKKDLFLILIYSSLLNNLVLIFN